MCACMCLCVGGGQVESLGGMSQAIQSGMPKLRIEEAAARKQARIDSKQEVIVGVNKYRLAQEPPIDVRAIDNTAVRTQQVQRIRTLKANRNESAVRTRTLAPIVTERERDAWSVRTVYVPACADHVAHRYTHRERERGCDCVGV
jgi:methylmalonyl-CoA mutase N-terminal domain/subunit